MMLPSTPDPSATKVSSNEGAASDGSLKQLPVPMSFEQAQASELASEWDGAQLVCTPYIATWENEYMSENDAICKLLRESSQDQLVRCMSDGCVDNPEPSPRSVALRKQRSHRAQGLSLPYSHAGRVLMRNHGGVEKLGKAHLLPRDCTAPWSGASSAVPAVHGQ